MADTESQIHKSKCMCGCGCKQACWDPYGSYCSDCKAGDCPGTCRCGKYGTLDDDGLCRSCARKQRQFENMPQEYEQLESSGSYGD